jgi:anaerobic magnesium-protoporphyrin IX monomethyl ester cyclase
VLLVHPAGAQRDSESQRITRLVNLMPPIGLVSIAAYLEQRGIATDVLDCLMHPDADERLRELLNDRRPAFVGFTCTTAGFKDAARLARLAHAVLPGVRTVTGGPHVSALTVRVLEEFPEIDLVVVGEGEATMAHLVESGGETPDRVPGIVWRDGDGVARFTGHREPIGDLDSLPYPAYEKLTGYPHAYRLPVFSYPRTPNSTCITSRGCPYACSYCDRSVFRRGYRFHSAAYVYEHLRYLRQRFGVRHVNIYDDQFTFDRGRMDELMGRLTGEPLDMTFNCAVRAEHVESGLLRRMKAAGCWMVSLGIESGDEKLLSQHRQKADLELVAGRIREIKRAGLRAKGLFMMGLPGETEASIRRSMRYALSLPLDEMNLTKFTPFPGSPIYRRIRESGAFDEDWDLMDCMHFVFVPQGLTRDRLDSLYREFYRRHFMRPRVGLGYAKLACQSPDNWRRFAGHLAEYWHFARRA